MLYGQWISGTGDLASAYEVRKAVFVEEQGWPEEIERDAFDKTAWHAMIYDEDKPVGTGRVYVEDGKYKAGRICVLPDYRKRGIGGLIFRSLLSRALSNGAEEIFLSAQEEVKGFYEQYGFRAISEPYPLGDQQRMHVDMRVAADEIVVPGGCGGSCASCSGCGA